MTRAFGDRRVLMVLCVAVVLALVAGWSLTRGPHTSSPSSLPAAAIPGPSAAVVPASGTTVDLSDPAIDGAPSAQRRAFADVAAVSRAYFRGMDTAMHTGDVSPFVAAIDPRCTCRAFATTMRGIYADGSISGGAISVTKMHVLDVSGRTSGVTVDYIMQSHTVRQHGKDTFYPGYLIHASLFVWREDNGTWKVGDLTRLAEDPL